MHNGDIDRSTRRRRTIVGALALLTVAGTVSACTPEPKADRPAAAPDKVATTYFGPDRYGKLTITMTESEALATGELQRSPMSTVLGKNVYSFVGGPKPDRRRMAADEKIEREVEKADKGGFGDSAEGSAKAAKAYADSTVRLSQRLTAYLAAGGASFKKGVLTSIAAPPKAATEAGIKRGSTVAELKSAYADKGLKNSSKTAYELPVAGHPGWTILFEVEGDTVLYMSLGQ